MCSRSNNASTRTVSALIVIVGLFPVTHETLTRRAQYARGHKFPETVLMQGNMNNHLLSSPVITIDGNSAIYNNGDYLGFSSPNY